MNNECRLSRRAFVAAALAAGAGAASGAFAPLRPYRFSGANLKPPTVCWLGINGFEFRLPCMTILIDPCVSRYNASPISDPAKVARYIGHADVIFLTHSHWDHMIDVPHIVARNGALVYGSETTLNICRAMGVPEHRLRLIGHGTRIDLAKRVAVRVIRSIHKQPVAYVGHYKTVPAALNSRAQYLCGEVFGFLFDFDGLRLLNIGSSNMDPSAIKGTSCDSFYCGVSNYFDSPGFPQLVHDTIRFTTFVPTHHDNFLKYELASYETENVSALIKNDFNQFKAEINQIATYGEERFRELVPLRTVPLV